MIRPPSRSLVRAVAATALVAGVAGPVVAGPASSLEAGARVGFLVSSYAIDDAEGGPTISSKVGPTAALAVRWLHGAWSIEGELGVSDRGARVDDGDATVAFHAYTLDLPLLAARAFTVDAPLAPRVVAGLAPTFQFAGRDAADPGAEALLAERFDVELVLGVGAGWEAAGGRWLVDLRYHGGVRDLDGDPDGDGSLRNSGVSLTVAYVD